MKESPEKPGRFNYLANKGIDMRTIQDYLGHVSIAHTVRYTELSPHKFKGLWK